MHRVHVDKESWQGERIVLSEREQHHLLDVLRKGPGDRVQVFDGEGREARACLVAPAGETQRIVLQVVTELSRAPVGPELNLLVALPKGKRMDIVVEKGTELGISAFWPLVTDRVISRPDERQSLTRCERWRRIAVSASKQCGRALVPTVHEITPLADAIDRFGRDAPLLFGDLRPGARGLRGVLADKRAGLERLGLLIGPEGDLTPQELTLLEDTGATGVALGPLVLRVETAALYAAAVLAYELS